MVKIVDTDEASVGQEKNQPTGQYANGFTVGHNAFEFLLDFYQTYAEDTAALLHTRIITTPVYAKGLSLLLQKSIAQYEQAFGSIRDESTA